jgi:hypothetical protein
MHDNVHVSFDAHWLVVPDERPLHQVIAWPWHCRRLSSGRLFLRINAYSSDTLLIALILSTRSDASTKRKDRRLRTISSRALPAGRINSIVLLRLSDQEQSMAIDFSTVNWLYVAIMAVFAFVASLLGGLISFRNRIGGALLAAILFAAMYVVWNYYPHPQIQLPIVTAYSTPSGG